MIAGSLSAFIIGKSKIFQMIHFNDVISPIITYHLEIYPSIYLFILFADAVMMCNKLMATLTNYKKIMKNNP